MDRLSSAIVGEFNVFRKRARRVRKRAFSRGTTWCHVAITQKSYDNWAAADCYSSGRPIKPAGRAWQNKWRVAPASLFLCGEFGHPKNPPVFGGVSGLARG
jgi:hypothetical protein